jgi:hypothetical protein
MVSLVHLENEEYGGITVRFAIGPRVKVTEASEKGSKESILHLSSVCAFALTTASNVAKPNAFILHHQVRLHEVLFQ